MCASIELETRLHKRLKGSGDPTTIGPTKQITRLHFLLVPYLHLLPTCVLFTAHKSQLAHDNRYWNWIAATSYGCCNLQQYSCGNKSLVLAKWNMRIILITVCNCLPICFLIVELSSWFPTSIFLSIHRI